MRSRLKEWKLSQPKSKVIQEFPQLASGQVAMVLVDRTRGCVMRMNGEIFTGEPEPIYQIFDGIDKAREEGRRIMASLPHVVCVIQDSTGKELDRFGL
jgi:hypothetical protein